MRGFFVLFVLAFIFTSVAFLLWRRRANRTALIPAYANRYWGGGKEKRRSVRFKKKLAVTCSVPEKTGNVHHIFSRDISGEGICLRTPEILPEGILINLTIRISNGGFIRAEGEVVWVSECEAGPAGSKRLFDTGVRFTKVSPRDKSMLSRFLGFKYKLDEPGEV